MHYLIIPYPKSDANEVIYWLNAYNLSANKDTKVGHFPTIEDFWDMIGTNHEFDIKSVPSLFVDIELHFVTFNNISADFMISVTTHNEIMSIQYNGD